MKCEISNNEETYGIEDFIPGETVTVTWEDGTITTETVKSVEHSNDEIRIIFESGEWIGNVYDNPDDSDDLSGKWVCVKR